jgi:mannosyltransferase
MKNNSKPTYEVILGNSNKRFSGVTSTMLQTLKHQQSKITLRVLGKHHLPDELAHLNIGFWQLVRDCKTPLPNGNSRVFHARRNDEMIQALLLKKNLPCEN